jgi:hypothetical protein
MGKRDPRVDAYIKKSQPFARPILEHIRAVVHDGCPDVEESIKWGFPFFLHHGMLISMAAFKAHASMGFWRARGILPDALIENAEGMGSFGKLESVKDLPAKKVLIGYVKAAAARNEAFASGELEKPKARKKAAAKPLVVPPLLQKALAKNAKARAGFQKLTPSQQREYADWIAEAKREETAAKRLATTIEWLAEGKSRNWKYQDC